MADKTYLKKRGTLIKMIMAMAAWIVLSSSWIFMIYVSAEPASDITDQNDAFSQVTGDLPVLSIEIAGGNMPSDDPEDAYISYYEADPAGGISVKEAAASIKLRGNTSRLFPKKSFRLTTVNKYGLEEDFIFTGLRTDDDWILNPMYSDTSKIREALSYWIWNEMNSCGRNAQSSRLIYTELIINGEYQGLYAIQERIDRKQVDADKKDGVLFKIISNERPEASELKTLSDERSFKCFKLEFCGRNVTDPWLLAEEYINILNGGERDHLAELSVENTIDIGLWAAFTQAKDNHFKNQFINFVEEDGKFTIYRIPWDLNHTFGDLWYGSSPETNYLVYRHIDIEADDAFDLLLENDDGSFADSVKARWSQLRRDVITEERLIAYASGLFDLVYDALAFDTSVWPEGGMGEGNAVNIRDIEKYIKEMIPEMDAWVDSLGD